MKSRKEGILRWEKGGLKRWKSKFQQCKEGKEEEQKSSFNQRKGLNKKLFRGKRGRAKEFREEG